jgi:hypothetical protein
VERLRTLTISLMNDDGKRAEQAEAKLAEHLAAHRTADAHDCAEMEEAFQREKARADEAEAKLAKVVEACWRKGYDVGMPRQCIFCTNFEDEPHRDRCPLAVLAAAKEEP